MPEKGPRTRGLRKRARRQGYRRDKKYQNIFQKSAQSVKNVTSSEASPGKNAPAAFYRLAARPPRRPRQQCPALGRMFAMAPEARRVPLQSAARPARFSQEGLRARASEFARRRAPISSAKGSKDKSNPCRGGGGMGAGAKRRQPRRDGARDVPIQLCFSVSRKGRAVNTKAADAKKSSLKSMCP